jgi:diguanylate cyclase (GGDEF)-like protein
VGASLEVSAHVLRARRTAALARAALAFAGIALVAIEPALAYRPDLAVAGFAFIVLTSSVQLALPRESWLVVEESVAGLAGMLIVGLGDQRVGVLSVLWLAAVASGVLARGGRVHWIGRAVVLSSLLLPIVRWGELKPGHAGLVVASIGLLLTCGRLTRELNHLLTRARHDADHDGLTGALSREAFRLALSARGAAPSALLLIDLDGFGQVNKLQGHKAGDALLLAAVDRIRTAVGVESPVGRLGGDEFGAIVDADDPVAVARRVLDGLAIPASVGIAQMPADGDDAEALLRAADVALRVAKRGRGEPISIYAGESFGKAGLSGPRAAIARLIEGDGIAMVVQPIVGACDAKPHAYEALARFRTGSGTDSPLHWFALADEFGLRDELEIACLKAALELLPGRPAGTRLSVNLSGPLLVDERVYALLAAQPDLSGLIVEVTEQALVDHEIGIHEAVAPLLARGAQLAIDDMGAGYSGLRQVSTLRPAYLKLDRSLVGGIDADPDRAALLRALVGYAAHGGSHIVAEGVETAAERETIAALGIPLIQGWYFGRPAAPWPEVRDPGALGLRPEDVRRANAQAAQGGVPSGDGAAG